jgi:hypothetical protein
MKKNSNTNQKIINDFRKLLQEEIDKLHCSSHPKVCELRDKNIGRLRRLLTTEILSDKHLKTPSIQTAIATLETELL